MARMLGRRTRFNYVSVVFSSLFVLGVMVGFVRSQEREAELKEGFSIADIDESGEKKWEVIGSAAQFISKHEIEIYDVRAFIYRKGKGDTLIMTDKAIFNSQTKEIHSNQFVTIVGEDTVITGIGLLWKPREKKITILSDVKMDIAKDEEKYKP